MVVEVLKLEVVEGVVVENNRIVVEAYINVEYHTHFVSLR